MTDDGVEHRNVFKFNYYLCHWICHPINKLCNMSIFWGRLKNCCPCDSVIRSHWLWAESTLTDWGAIRNYRCFLQSEVSTDFFRPTHPPTPILQVKNIEIHSHRTLSIFMYIFAIHTHKLSALIAITTPYGLKLNDVAGCVNLVRMLRPCFTSTFTMCSSR